MPLLPSCFSLYLPLHSVISYHSLEDRIVKRFMAGECAEVLVSQKKSRGYQLARRRALRNHRNQQDWTPHNAETSKPQAEGVYWTFQALHRKVRCYCMETLSQLFTYMCHCFVTCVLRPSLQDLMRCPAIHEQDQPSYGLQLKQ